MNKLMAGLNLVIVLMALPSFGLNAVERKLRNSAKHSPYEVLRDFYSSSPQAAQLTDIDYFTTKTRSNAQKCVMAGESYKNPVNVLLVRIVYQEMSVPNQGPLFPGHGVIKAESAGLFGYISEEVPSFGGLADAMDITSNDSDLVMTYNGLATNYGDAKPYVLSVRKNDGLLAFSYLVTGTENQNVIYGYCYRETARH